MVRRTASGKRRRSRQGQSHPEGRVAAGSGVVIGLDRCPASLSGFFPTWPGLQHDEIIR